MMLLVATMAFSSGAAVDGTSVDVAGALVRDCVGSFDGSEHAAANAMIATIRAAPNQWRLRARIVL